MTKTVFRRIAVAGLAVVALAGVASCSSSESKAKSDIKTVDRDLHNAAVKSYDDTKSVVDKAGDKIGDGSRTVYDKAKSDLESFGGDLEDAASKTGDDAKRAYRDVHHRLGSIDRDIGRHLHRPAQDIGNAEYDAWNDMKDGLHHTREAIDHVLDKL